MSKIKYLPFLLLAIVPLFHPAHADNDQVTALLQTQDCLRNQTCASQQSSAGMAADRKALEAVLGNAAAKQELYAISADVMGVLYQQSGGDPAKMQNLVQNAQNNPEAFLQSLPKDILDKIEHVAQTVENNQQR